MCGIAGIYSYRESSPPVDREELLRIREAMIRRGPDGAGLWISNDQRIGLAHRRLAIIDLSEAGAQPMLSADGRLCITFNGEIYNYRELRRELEAKGCVFRSHSDTEVLLHLYAERGEAMVHALRGMFAFAIWDERKKGIFLARDHFGIKPLYYADDGATIRMASQVKALLAGGAIDTAEDTAGHASFFLFGSVADPFTLYRNIRALPAGSTLWVDQHGAGQPRQFFRIANEFAAAEANPQELEEDGLTTLVNEALRDSVCHHLIADVPVGLFLSSGIDSTSLAGLATEVGTKNLRTLTLGFHEYRNTANDEVPLAETVARHFGTTHQTKWVDRAAFDQELSSVIHAMDQPSIDGVNTYFVAKLAAELGMKVALSGLGGDELLGGYPSFQDIPRLKKWLAWSGSMPGVGRLARRIAAPIVKRITSPKFAGLMEYGGTYAGAYLLRRGLYMPWELGEVMGAERARAGIDALEPLLRLNQSMSGVKGERPIVASLELEWYMRCQLLRDSDWAGMAHSLEVRLPFVDVNFFRALAPALVSRHPPSKLHLANGVANTLPTQEVRERKKTGFTTPVKEWTVENRLDPRPERGLRGWARFILRNQWPRKKRVLISSLKAEHGGVVTMTRTLVNLLLRRGYDVALAYYMPYRLAPELSVPTWQLLYKYPSMRSGVALGDVPSFEIGVRVPELECVRCIPSKLWRQVAHQFDFHLAVSGSALAALPILLQNKPCLTWVATPYAADKIDRVRHYPWYRQLVDKLIDSPICCLFERLALRKASVLALSNYTAIALTAIEPLTGSTIMPMPIDTKLFYPANVLNRPLTRIGFAGRFADPRKNTTLLFDAVAACHARGIKVSCGLIGDDPLPEYAAYLSARNLSDYVTFHRTRQRSELAGYYNNLDVFVIPSHQEGLGIVGLEAMACGCPVVSTHCGGTADYVKDGVNGYLVGFSADEMAEAIIRILTDPNLHRLLRAGALQTISEGYGEAGVERLFWRQFDSVFGEGVN